MSDPSHVSRECQHANLYNRIRKSVYSRVSSDELGMMIHVCVTIVKESYLLNGTSYMYELV